MNPMELNKFRELAGIGQDYASWKRPEATNPSSQIRQLAYMLDDERIGGRLSAPAGLVEYVDKVHTATPGMIGKLASALKSKLRKRAAVEPEVRSAPKAVGRYHTSNAGYHPKVHPAGIEKDPFAAQSRHEFHSKSARMSGHFANQAAQDPKESSENKAKLYKAAYQDHLRAAMSNFKAGKHDDALNHFNAAIYNNVLHSDWASKSTAPEAKLPGLATAMKTRLSRTNRAAQRKRVRSNAPRREYTIPVYSIRGRYRDAVVPDAAPATVRDPEPDAPLTQRTPEPKKRGRPRKSVESDVDSAALSRISHAFSAAAHEMPGESNKQKKEKAKATKQARTSHYDTALAKVHMGDARGAFEHLKHAEAHDKEYADLLGPTGLGKRIARVAHDNASRDAYARGKEADTSPSHANLKAASTAHIDAALSKIRAGKHDEGMAHAQKAVEYHSRLKSHTEEVWSRLFALI